MALNNTPISHHLVDASWLTLRSQLVEDGTRHNAPSVARITPLRLLIVASVTGWVMFGCAVALFLWPRTVGFSYSGANCFTNPIALPSLVKVQQGGAYSTILQPTVSLANNALFSYTTCIDAHQAPKENTRDTVTLSALGGWPQKHLTISSAEAPKLSIQTSTRQPVPSQKPLYFSLSQPDRVFSYRLAVGDKSTDCSYEERGLACELAPLSLTQSTRYTIALERTFRGKPVRTVLTESLTTIEAIKVTNTSISPGEYVLDEPNQVTLTLNKDIKSLGTVDLRQTSNDTPRAVTIRPETSGNTVIIHFEQPLPRDAPYQLRIDTAESDDGSYLDEPFVIDFRMSGGPKVTNPGIGTTKVAQDATINLTFDSALGKDQDISSFVRLVDARGTIPARMTYSGRNLTIKPDAPLPRCTSFSIKITDGLKNEFGISGGSAWQYNSRTLCQTAFRIGASVQGRDITAYSFGTGPEKIIFVGGTHGNEKSSAYILNDWISYLETNPDIIPSNRTVIIIPKLSPDGFAANRRTNANNVDLNRNFPAHNWKTGVVEPDHSFLPNGGGVAPLSEPESKALADFVLSQQPRLVLTYHADADVVAPNGAGDSVGLARIYADKSPVWFLANDQSPEVFDYDTTGAFEDWLHDAHGIPALLVELTTQAGYEFSAHRSAMSDVLTR